MMDSNRKIVLRIVSSHYETYSNFDHNLEPTQLELGLFDDKKNIFYLTMNDLSGESFSHLLKEKKWRYVLDLRFCPRFDMYGYSRKKAFLDFYNNHIEYLSLTMNEYSDSIIENLYTLIEKADLNFDKFDDSIALFIDKYTDEVEQIPIKASIFKSWTLKNIGKEKKINLHVVKNIITQ